MKKIIFLLTILLFPIMTFASDITNKSLITINNTTNNKIIDNNENSYISINSDEIIKITSEENIYGIYIIYELTSKTGIVSLYDKNIAIGENGFLHEYIDIYKSIIQMVNIGVIFSICKCKYYFLYVLFAHIHKYFLNISIRAKLLCQKM